MKNIITGDWFAHGSSQSYPAQLKVSGQSVQLEVGSVVKFECEISQLMISDRVGNIARKIRFEDGSVFNTHDNAGVDEQLVQNLSFARFIYNLEGNLKWVSVAIAVTVITVFSFVRWGVPWISYEIAHALPLETNQLISEGTMVALDKHFFKPSKVSIDKQSRIKKHFQAQIAPLETDDELAFNLHFREWRIGNQSIPNALVLPSGDIIVTDALLQLSQNQTEIDSILLHEMGHVVHRHGLQSMIEGATLTALFVMMFGDANALVDVVVGTSGALLSSHYSREHETEADIYAFKKMLTAGIDPKHFSIIMNRLDDDHSHEQSASDYFASHPQTQKRIELANKYSQCFQLGDLVCE